jgi:D-threo-aldose 1-dehydrogenase
MPDTAHFAPPGPLGFGGAPLGNMFAAIDEATAEAALQAAWDSGIRYFDTAPHYGAGLSEHRFGHVLRQRPREEFVLSTKVGRLQIADRTAPRSVQVFVDALPFRPVYDYSADGTRRSIEDSPQRLGLSHIDIAYIHDVAEDTHGPAWEGLFDQAMDGAAQALTRLREEGVLRAWGLGVNLTEPCLRALDRADPDVFLLAGRYSLIDHAALDALFPACAARGVHVVVGGPFNSGLLAGGRTFNYAEAEPAQVMARDRVAAVCGRHGVDIRAAALQFCAAHPVVASVIPGAKGAARVRENAALMRAPIPADLWQALKAEGLLPEAAPTP